MNHTRTQFLIGALLSLGAWLIMLIWGGPGAPADAWAREWLAVADKPGIEGFARQVAWIGEWQVLTGAAVIGTILTAIHRRRRAALLLIMIVMGRLLVEIQKIFVGRLMPNAQTYFEGQQAPSFPSVHAANAMITFLAIALLLPSREWKHAVYITVALILAGLAGWSQAALGLAWPSDVVGGWAFGLFWVMICLRLATDRPGD
jgi:undecaprenyl-diphosphatase